LWAPSRAARSKIIVSGAAHSLTQPIPDLRCTTNEEQTLGLSKRNVQMLFFLVMNQKLSHTQTSKCRMTSYNDPPMSFFRNNISTSGTEKAPTGPTARGSYNANKMCSVFFPAAFRSSDRRWYSGFLVREEGNNLFNIYRSDHDFRVTGAPNRLSTQVFLNRRAVARYRTLGSIIPGRERFSWNWQLI